MDDGHEHDPRRHERGDEEPGLEYAPPEADDELDKYESPYEEAGFTSDADDEYGTGGGDVGIGGDVSPRGVMHDVAAPETEVRQDDELVAGSDQTREGVAERAEDLDLVSDDIEDQGIDEAWPRDEELDEDDARASFDDPDAPATDVRDEDELDAA